MFVWLNPGHGNRPNSFLAAFIIFIYSYTKSFQLKKLQCGAHIKFLKGLVGLNLNLFFLKVQDRGRKLPWKKTYKRKNRTNSHLCAWATGKLWGHQRMHNAAKKQDILIWSFMRSLPVKRTPTKLSHTIFFLFLCVSSIIPHMLKPLHYIYFELCIREGHRQIYKLYI